MYNQNDIKMKITATLSILFAMIIPMFSCASKNNSQSSDSDASNKTAIYYFSATGTTKAAAQRIAKLVNADLIEIAPREIYTDEDLDWRDSLSRSSIEMKDPTARPDISELVKSAGDYDTIFIGYPNWWNTAPRIINTFIEASDLNGKVVIPFMTSGGSNITNSENDLHNAYPDIQWKQGLLMNNVSNEEIKSWIKQAEK